MQLSVDGLQLLVHEARSLQALQAPAEFRLHKEKAPGGAFKQTHKAPQPEEILTRRAPPAASSLAE